MSPQTIISRTFLHCQGRHLQGRPGVTEMHCSQLHIQRIPLALTHLYGEREGKDTVQHGLADKDQIIKLTDRSTGKLTSLSVLPNQ